MNTVEGTIQELVASLFAEQEEGVISRQQFEDALRKISEVTAQAITSESPMSAEDVGTILGISDRRVRQIASERGVGEKQGRDWMFTWGDLSYLRPRPKGRPAINLDELKREYRNTLVHWNRWLNDPAFPELVASFIQTMSTGKNGVQSIIHEAFVKDQDFIRPGDIYRVAEILKERGHQEASDWVEEEALAIEETAL